MSYNPAKRARHPVAVAEMNDANSLVHFADYLDGRLGDLATAGAQSGTIHAIQLLRGAAKAMRP